MKTSSTAKPDRKRGQQDENLGGINAKLDDSGFRKAFPPEGVEIVDRYDMMGIGQVAILKFPGNRLRDVNPALERTAWGAFETAFHPTHDFMPVLRAIKEKHGLTVRAWTV